MRASVPPHLGSLVRAAFQYVLPGMAYRRLTSEEWREAEIEMELLPALVDPRREAVDVGANVGHYALRLAALVPRVQAFEPHPRLAYVLRRAMPHRVEVHSIAISDTCGRAVLTVPYFMRPTEGMASLSEHSGLFAEARSLMRIRVERTTLDTLADRDIGFVKIDVEGHEMQVLRGADSLIQRQRPTFLVEVEERHRSGAVREAFAFFAARDYVGLFALQDSILPVAEFRAEMQSPALISASLPRRQSNYVNDFISYPAPGAPPGWSNGWSGC